MSETWKHKVIREGLEDGHSFIRISKDTKLSVCAILREINEDINLKILPI